MTALPTFAEFEARARAEGFDEVLERHWDPGTVLDTHTHPAAVQAVVTQGEMEPTCGGAMRPLRAGDRFELARDEPHAERCGIDGATYWVARRR